MVSVLTSIVVDRGLELRSGQTKDYKIDVRCFSSILSSQLYEVRDCLARYQDNVSE
jgi:hypothetical protein